MPVGQCRTIIEHAVVEDVPITTVVLPHEWVFLALDAIGNVS